MQVFNKKSAAFVNKRHQMLITLKVFGKKTPKSL